MGLQLFKEDSNITKAFDPPAWNDKTGFLNSTVQGNWGVIKLDFFPVHVKGRMEVDVVQLENGANT